jgi:hypothetical protein
MNSRAHRLRRWARRVIRSSQGTSTKSREKPALFPMKSGTAGRGCRALVILVILIFCHHICVLLIYANWMIYICYVKLRGDASMWAHCQRQWARWEGCVVRRLPEGRPHNLTRAGSSRKSRGQVTWLWWPRVRKHLIIIYFVIIFAFY